MTDFLYAARLTIDLTPFHGEKHSPELKDFHCTFKVLKYFEVTNECLLSYQVHIDFYIIILHLHPERAKAYYTGSAFTQHYYVCQKGY